MTTAEAREVLIRYNAWRRYDGPLEQTPLQPEPKEIGEAIDVAIGVLSKEEASLEEAAKTNAKLNMTRTKLELNEIETLTHLVRAKAVEPGPYQGLYKGILSKLNIDAGIDLYIYGRKFLHYDRKEIGDVRVDMGDGKPWVPVKDWMKEGKDMTPDQLRAFAKYFYDRGRESYRVTIKGEELEQLPKGLNKGKI